MSRWQCKGQEEQRKKSSSPYRVSVSLKKQGGCSARGKKNQKEVLFHSLQGLCQSVEQGERHLKSSRALPALWQASTWPLGL